MGFWGMFMVAESAVHPRDVIPELPAEVEVEQTRLTSAAGDWSRWRIWTNVGRLSAELGHQVEVIPRSSVILAEFYDSDGARVDFVDWPSTHWTTYLNLDRTLGYIITPYAPFDAEGNELDEAAVEAQDAVYQRERDAEYARLHVPAATTAPAALAWAEHAGLTPQSTVAELIALLDSNELFAEDAFYDLLKALGLEPAAAT
ncbi:hypothetical protein E1263_16775 [Kribbella antibiotica]|uniref:Uncharacterized protein n=1 Tax=Kribbella antibiotica TaxID=190195 RepID=A0A4R4ZQ37_9ACTN|nr:hypothetical protein [Kribbella antibiotica]TDD59052.1 hypothetical protein E1263_16775 [Kribbella antibiotica]